MAPAKLVFEWKWMLGTMKCGKKSYCCYLGKTANSSDTLKATVLALATLGDSRLNKIASILCRTIQGDQGKVCLDSCGRFWGQFTGIILSSFAGSFEGGLGSFVGSFVGSFMGNFEGSFVGSFMDSFDGSFWAVLRGDL